MWNFQETERLCLFVYNTDICNWFVGWTETHLNNTTVHVYSPLGYATGNKLTIGFNLLLKSTCVMLYLHAHCTALCGYRFIVRVYGEDNKFQNTVVLYISLKICVLQVHENQTYTAWLLWKIKNQEGVMPSF
jgi:hypothetical protein